MTKIYRLGFMLMMALFLTASTVQAEAVLTIVSARVETGHPATGHQVKVTFVVKNKGADAVPGMTSLGVQIYSSNANGIRVAGDFVTPIPWNVKNIRALEPNESQEISATAVLNKVGMHTAEGVIVNETIASDKLLIENRMLRKTFKVFQPADVVLERAQFNHHGRLMLVMYNGGGRIPNAQFENSEIKVTTGGQAYQMMLRDAVPNTFQNATLGAMLGGSRRYTFAWPRPGTQGIRLDPSVKQKVAVTLDYNQVISDSNRTNNGIKKEIGGKPDLIVCYRKHNHSKPHRYSRYRPVVKNMGFAPSRKSYLRFWIADKGWKLYPIRALAPGSEQRISRRVYWVRTKNVRFRLTADFEKNVDEMFENNNKIEGIIHVGAYGIKTDILCSDSPGMTGFN